MAIYVFGVPKGGVGKTTTAVSFAAKLACDDRRVLLVDTDMSNRHSTLWAEERLEMHPEAPRIANIQLSGKSLAANLVNWEEMYDDIVVDCGGQDDPNWRYAAAVADKLLMPMRPSQFDTWSFNPIEEGLANILAVNPSLEYHVVWVQADPRSKEEQEAEEMVREFEIPIAPYGLPSRVVHRRCVREGLAAHEYRSSDSSAASARRELDELYEFVRFGKHPARVKEATND